MTNPGSNKSHLRRSQTSLKRRKKSERIGSDTTERRKPDDQDGKPEERYKTLVENIPCAVYSAFPGERGPTTFMSKNWKDWTGYSAEDLYQDPEAWPKCIYPDDREKTVNAYIEACRNEVSYNLEYRIIHRETGQIRYVRDQGLLSKDTKDTLIRVDGNIADITELKTSENELEKCRDHLEELVKERTSELEKANEVLKLQDEECKKVMKSLRESENRYKAVVENAQEGILVVQDKKLRFANPAVMSMLDYTEEELTSRSFIEFVHPDDRDQVMDIHVRRFKGEGVPPIYECRVVDKQSNVKWIENNGILIEWGGRPATLNFLRDITERKKTEEELKKHQYYLEKAQDIGRIGTWELDIETNILVWTDGNYRIFGVPKGTELTYEAFLNCIHPDDREYVDTKWKAALNKEPYDIEHRILVDGEVRWVREKAELDFDDRGNCVRGIGFTQDITERKKAEQDLLLVRQLIDDSGEGICWIDKDARIVNANLAGCRQLGYSKEEMLSMTVHDIDPNFPKERWSSHWEELRQKGSMSFETLNIHKSGNIFPVEIRNNFVKFEDKEYIFVFVNDITDRKKAEKELKENEERFRSLSNAAFEGIVITKEGRFVDANAAFTNLFGYEPDEITGKEVKMLVAPEDRKLVTEKIRSGYEKPYEHKALRKDGSVLDVEVCGKTVLIKGQECRITAIRDITERKKAEEKLLDYQTKLKSLASQLSVTEESERRRIATELHDHIGQSLVFSKIKLDELHHSATSSELTKALEEICNNIGQIIRDTRTLTFDLSSPILNELGFEAAVAEWLDVQVREKQGIETEFVDDGQQKPLDDDIQALLFRNVRELLVNVIKHAQARKVKVSVRRVNEHIHIDVEDDGKGFDSVKVISTAIEETKFGLFSIRQRLEQLGGQFEIDTEENRGSKITMTAPLKLTKLQR